MIDEDSISLPNGRQVSVSTFNTRNVLASLAHSLVVAACMLLQSENVVQWMSVHVYLIFPPLRMFAQSDLGYASTSSWKRVDHICIRLAINQPRAKTRWCCCTYSRGRIAPTEVSTVIVANCQG